MKSSPTTTPHLVARIRAIRREGAARPAHRTGGFDFESTRTGRLFVMDVGTTELGLAVGEVAVRTGLTTYTLRWYEQEGLLPPVERDASGRRRYSRTDLARLAMINRLRRTGMPVRQMRRYAELARQGDHTAGQRRALLEAHREQVRARIAALAEDLGAVEQKIEMYRSMEEKS